MKSEVTNPLYVEPRQSHYSREFFEIVDEENTPEMRAVRLRYTGARWIPGRGWGGLTSKL